MMLYLVYSRPEPPPEESWDTQELCAAAMELLEDVKRSAWSGIGRDVRLQKLAEAERIVKRVRGLESGAVALPMFGD